MKIHPFSSLLATAGMLACLILASCAPVPPAVSPAITLTPAATLAVVPPTPQDPTPSPQPGKAALVIAPGSDPTLAKSVQSAVERLARQSGLPLEINPTGSGNWKVAVYLNPSAEMPKTAAGLPGTQFLAISQVDLDKAPNLSVIRIHSEQEAFLAGYITMLAAPEWRAGALLASDSPLGDKLDEVFRNGGYFFCGACRSALSPMLSFPITANLPSGSAMAAWQAALDELRKSIIYTLYVSPQAASPEFLQYLVAQKFYLVGGATPAQEIRSRWVATVSSDALTPLQQMWPGLASGQGGQVVDAPVVVSDVQAGLLGGGRMEKVEELRKNLADGQVYPFSVK
jgi:hypothetical protein